MDTHAAAAHTEHDSSVPETGLRFEKSELEDFVADDKTAGQAIGKLLAVVFLISFVLMSGVCTWMLSNNSHGTDPQAGIGDETATVHH